MEMKKLSLNKKTHDNEIRQDVHIQLKMMKMAKINYRGMTTQSTCSFIFHFEIKSDSVAMLDITKLMQK